VQRRERHLAGAGQVEVVVGHAVDLLVGVGQHARPEQGLLPDEHRRHHRLKPLLAQPLERPANQRQLQQHQRPLDVREARPGHAGARLEVHQSPK
jgi:hypothetical protein